jgi:hypothetical protein
MKTRVVQTKFWEDTWVIQLTQQEKLAFLYFMTNPRVNLSGVYQLPDKFITNDLDLEFSELVNIKNKFTKADKVHFVDGFVILRNSRKYNNFFKGNEWQRKAFNREIELLPKTVKDYLEDNQFDLILEWLKGCNEGKEQPVV